MSIQPGSHPFLNIAGVDMYSLNLLPWSLDEKSGKLSMLLYVAAFPSPPSFIKPVSGRSNPSNQLLLTHFLSLRKATLYSLPFSRSC